MSTNPDTVISSESPQNRVSDGLLVLKTETLTDEPNKVSDFSIQDSIDKTMVSGSQVEVVAVMGENGVKVEAETGLLKSKAETEGRSCDGNGDIDVRDSADEVRVSGDELGVVKEDVEKVSDVNVISSEETEGDKAAVGAEILAVPDAVNEVGVSGDEVGVVMEDVEKGLDVNDEGKEGDKAVVGSDLLDSKTETLTVDLSSENDAGGGVSADEPATVLENVLDEKMVNSEVKEGSKAVVGDDLLDSKNETLTMESASDLDQGGNTVLQDSVGDASISADEREIAMEKAGNSLDGGVANNEGNKGDKTVNGADLLDMKTETRMMEASTDHDEGGDIGMQNSADEIEVVMENVEKALHGNVGEEVEKDGEYKVGDMIWAKVKNYPWWPGQIFDPSASTDNAKKYSNKKAFFVAYFGDQSFAWNKASNIKAFRKNFSKMEKQSNSKGFCHAVNCALDEASRRVDFGLACSCLSKEVFDKTKTQVFVNAGIKSEASRIDGGDRFSTVATFKPENIVRSVQDLAREHFDGYSKLEFMSVRTQLLAYYRWKGYKIAEYYEHLPWKEDKVEDAKPASVGEKVSSKEWKLKACDSVSSKEEKDHTNMTRMGSSRDRDSENAKTDSVSEKVSSKKRKLEACDSVSSKKEKRITDIDPEGSLSLSNGKDKVKKIGAGKATFEDDKVVEDAKVVYTKKRKSKASDSVPSKKGKHSTNMTTKGSSSVSNGKSKSKRKENGGKIIATEGNGVKEESQNGSGDKKTLTSSPKKSFTIGDSIMRIAKQLSGSPSILKKESQESRQSMEKNSQKREKDKFDKQTENSPTLHKVPKTDRKKKKKDRK